MNCREIKRNITAYMDGELTNAENDAVFEHLAECEACRDLVGEVSYCEALFANVMKVHMSAPASLRYNVLSAISREKARPVYVPVWQRFAWRPATAMAAVLALAGAGWRTFQTSFIPPTVATHQTAPVLTAKAPTAKPALAPVVSAPAAVTANKPVVAVKAPPRKAPASVQPKVEPPAAPVRIADASIGTVTDITTIDNIANGRFLSRVDGKGDWTDAASEFSARTHLQTTEDTIVTLQLRDGTTLKSNAHTEFVVLRSPTREDASWQIRLVRGELWVKSGADVVISAPNVEARTTAGEFCVRSLDGDDTTVMVVEGLVSCRNDLGTILAGASQASVAVPGEAPREAFDIADPQSQMGWVYAPAPAHNPQNDGGTQA